MYCAYFFDTAHGVVAGSGAIWKFTNGIWSSPSTPLGQTFYFTSVNELKPGVLYATSGDTDVWFSSDSGASWHNTTTAGSFALDAYFTKDDSLHSTAVGTFARLDSNICILSSNNGQVPYYSSDGGKTWKAPTGYTTIGGLGAYADTCRKMFFACSKSGPAYYSLDSGHTWHASGPTLSQDILNGADGAVFHQDSSGVWCSVDGGSSWQLLGGPKATSGDRGIFGFGPKGKWIVAMTGETVWLYSRVDSLQPADPITRGDTIENCPITRIPVTVRAFTRPYQISMQVITSGPQTLTPRDTTFIIQPGSPITVWYTLSPTISQKPTFVGLSTTATDGCRQFEWYDTFSVDPVPIPISIPNVQMRNCLVSSIPLEIYSASQPLKMYVTVTADSGWAIQPPDTAVNLAAGAHSTFWLTPTAPSLPIGSLVHIHAYDTTSCTILNWDTSFTISVVPVPVTWSWVNSSMINACDSVSIPISLDLASCDSLSMDSLFVTPSEGLLNFESIANISLARGQKDTVWLTYAPRGRADTTKYSLNIHGHFVPEGIPMDTALPLKAGAFGSPHPRASVASSVALPTCSQVTLPLLIKASGCENIRIDSIQHFTNGVMVSGGLSAPDTVIEGTTDTIRYTLEATYPTTQPQPIDFYCYLYRLGDLEEFDTLIVVDAAAFDQSSQPLISAPAKLDLSNCTTSIVPMVLHTACDSAIVTSCLVSVPNGVKFSTNIKFPDTLQPGEYDTLLISFPPQDLNTIANISAGIRGGYEGAISGFDTTGQTQVTFVCTDGVTEAQQEAPTLGLKWLQSPSDPLQFELSKNNTSITECQGEIISMLGDIVATRSFQMSSAQNECSWDLNGLPSGEYYLRISTGDARVSARFVLVR